MNKYKDKPGHHRHECLDCGLVWEHSDSHNNDWPGHICPNPSCQSRELWDRLGEVYQGPMAPSLVVD